MIWMQPTLDCDGEVNVKDKQQNHEADQSSELESQDACDEVLFSLNLFFSLCHVIASYTNLKSTPCLTSKHAACGLGIVDMLGIACIEFVYKD